MHNALAVITGLAARPVNTRSSPSIQAAAVHNTLAVFESILDADEGLKGPVAKEAGLMVWLLTRIKQRPFHANKVCTLPVTVCGEREREREIGSLSSVSRPSAVCREECVSCEEAPGEPSPRTHGLAAHSDQAAPLPGQPGVEGDPTTPFWCYLRFLVPLFWVSQLLRVNFRLFFCIRVLRNSSGMFLADGPPIVCFAAVRHGASGGALAEEPFKPKAAGARPLLCSLTHVTPPSPLTP